MLGGGIAALQILKAQVKLKIAGEWDTSHERMVLSEVKKDTASVN